MKHSAKTSVKRLLAVVLGLLVLGTAAPAAAVPTIVAFTGRLSTSSGPVDGDVAVTFRIMSAQTGGNELWTESYDPLTADDGLVYASLGSQEPLDGSVFDGRLLYLEITIEGETLSPRLPLGSVPYAVRSDTADTLGDIEPDDVVTDVIGGSGVTATRSGNGVTLSITAGSGISVGAGGVALTTCPNGQILKSNGSGYACAADAGGTTYTGGAGISISGSTVALTTCPNGQILKSNGSGYACAADANTTYSGSAPISVSGSTISLNACLAGQVLKHNGSSWSCQEDRDPIAFGYINSDGSRLSGTSNWSSSLSGTTYTIAITGESYLFSQYSAFVQTVETGVFCRTSSVGGNMLVICQNTAGTLVTARFAFVVFKP